MRRINRNWKVIGVISTIVLLVFSIEVLSYVANTRDWVQFQNAPEAHGAQRQDLHENEALRILIVADPQIQGEKQESRLFGWLTRWDSDRYLYKNYRLAKHHVQPHSILFLGDLFDEGSKASGQEYQRYLKRFEDIFELPAKSDSAHSKSYVFLPGDNDVEGEDGEIIDVGALKLFNETFGEYRGVYWLKNSGWNIQFFKLNMFLPDVYNNPAKGFSKILNSDIPDYRILLSHMSLLNFLTQSVETVIDKIHPTLIISAHNHRSSFYHFEGRTADPENSPHVTSDFLVGHRPGSTKKSSSTSTDSSFSASTTEAVPLAENRAVRFNMRKIHKQQKDVANVYEINVPTCSYRMGVTDMGFGSLQIYNNGSVDYTVLWLPSRFKQLYFYLIFYIIGTVIVTPWLLCKSACLFGRYQNWRNTKMNNHYI